MTILEAAAWVDRIAAQRTTSGMTEINGTVRVGRYLAAELERKGYSAEHTNVYPGRQRIQYTRRTN